MVLHITNMDSAEDLCSVRHELEQRGFSLEWYDIGRATIESKVSESELSALTDALAAKGFGILRNSKELLSEQVKQIVQEVILCPKFLELHNITAVLSKRMGYNYRYLSRLFSHTEKITIEHYVIVQKIERVKALLMAEQPHSLSDIAFELNYSSVAHLSAEFKVISGETIRTFRAKHGRPLHERSSHTTLGSSALGNLAVGRPAVGRPAVGRPAVGRHTRRLAMQSTHRHDHAIREPKSGTVESAIL